MLHKIVILKNTLSSLTSVLCGHIKNTCFSVCTKNQIGKTFHLRSSITNFSTQSCYRIMALPRDTYVSSSSVSIN